MFCMNDVLSIDESVPLVILFGPPCCGKTMTLMSLSMYLMSEGYHINSFEETFYQLYEQLQGHVYRNVRPNSFMQVRILDRFGRGICQILKLPGDICFNPYNEHYEFPKYLCDIFNNSKLHKIFVFFTEPLHDDLEMRYQYTLQYLLKRIQGKCKFVILYNKIDQTPFVLSPGRVDTAAAKIDLSNNSPGILVSFKNKNIITRFWKPYMCDIIPPQTGEYYENKYHHSSAAYNKKLWKLLLQYVRDLKV